MSAGSWWRTVGCPLVILSGQRRRGEKERTRELDTFSVVSAGHDCVGLLVGWFWCEAGVKLEIEPWRAVLATRFLLLRLDWRGRVACQI